MEPAELSSSRGSVIAPGGYFDAFRASAEQAIEAVGRRAGRLVLAGHTLDVELAGPALGPAMAMAFRGMEARAEDAAPGPGEARVLVYDTASTGIEPPTPPWDPAELPGGGEATIRVSDDVWGSYAPDCGRLSLVDRRRREAVVHFPDAALLPWNERAAPLRHVLHWLVERPGLRMLHAAGVGRGGQGALLVGRSGAGKTTLALACLARGLDYLGDDYVAVETFGEPRAHSIYATAKPSAETLRRVGGFDADALVDIGREPGSKAALGLAERHGDRLPAELKISLLVVPELVAGDGGTTKPAPRSAAMLAMAPSTIIQHPSRGGEAMGEIASLARRLPCRLVEVGDDPTAAAATVEELLGDG